MKKIRILVAGLIAAVLFQIASYATTGENENGEQVFYFNSVVNTGKDNGYSKADSIGAKDPHFGWTLGRFVVSGFTSVNRDENNPVFLKNVGDKVKLSFRLEQDIDNLNGDKNLTIASDNNGYDEYFGIPKTDFGRGTLITRHKDYKNLEGTPQVYTNYLAAGLSINADTTVQLCEEGDYEVALDYEIKKTTKFLGAPIPDYTNYRIFFKFSVRNSNCMVYPFDVTTKTELTNTSITENGFYLDLARTRYLDVNVKKIVMVEGPNGITEDVRFNRSAKDGDMYTEEGIYVITAKNKETNEQTEKRIYVGTDSVMKAHVVTGMSINEINDLVRLGATIDKNGNIDKSTMNINNGDTDINSEEVTKPNEKKNSAAPVIIIIVILVVLAAGATAFLILKKKGVILKGKTKSETDDKNQGG